MAVSAGLASEPESMVLALHCPSYTGSFAARRDHGARHHNCAALVSLDPLLSHDPGGRSGRDLGNARSAGASPIGLLCCCWPAPGTAEVPAFSAAGATGGPPGAGPPPADACSILLLGTGRSPPPMPCPPLPAGVSPALISHVVRGIGAAPSPWVVDLGCPDRTWLVAQPATGRSASPLLSTGAALGPERGQGSAGPGRRWEPPLGDASAAHRPDCCWAECVPGRNQHAQPLLCGLGIGAAGLVSGSPNSRPMA